MAKVCFQVLVALTALFLTQGSLSLAQPKPKRSPSIETTIVGTNSIQIRVLVPLSQNLKGLSLELDRRGGSQARTTYLVRNLQRSFSIVDRLAEAGAYRYRARLGNRRGRSPWTRFSVVRVEEPDPGPEARPQPPGRPVIPNNFRECGDQQFYAPAFARVIEIREIEGSSAVATEPQLYYAALAHSIQMAEQNRLSHDGFVNEMQEFQVPGTSYGQNVASHRTDPLAAIEAWLGSPPHRSNLLNPKWTRMAIGCVVDESGIFWWTQNFSK